MKRILALGAAILFLAALCIFPAGCAVEEANGGTINTSGPKASPSAIIIDDEMCTCQILLPQEMTERYEYYNPEAIGECLAKGIRKWRKDNPHKKLVEMGPINYIWRGNRSASAPTGGMLIYYEYTDEYKERTKPTGGTLIYREYKEKTR